MFEGWAKFEKNEEKARSMMDDIWESNHDIRAATKSSNDNNFDILLELKYPPQLYEAAFLFGKASDESEKDISEAIYLLSQAAEYREFHIKSHKAIEDFQKKQKTGKFIRKSVFVRKGDNVRPY